MPVNFDAKTAYADEWQYVDGLSDGTLIPKTAEGVDQDLHQDVKVRELDILQTAFSGSAGGAGFRASTTVMELWQTNTSAAPPKNGDSIRDANNVNWAVHSVRKRLYGPMYECLVSMVGETGAADEL